MENEISEYLKKEGITLNQLSSGAGIPYPAIYACLGPSPARHLTDEEAFKIGLFLGKRAKKHG